MKLKQKASTKYQKTTWTRCRLQNTRTMLFGLEYLKTLPNIAKMVKYLSRLKVIPLFIFQPITRFL